VENRILNLRLSDFEKEGLYLLFPDSTTIELTKENIEKVTGRFHIQLKVFKGSKVLSNSSSKMHF